MFRKTKDRKTSTKTGHGGSEILSVIAKDTHILGTIVSDGTIDFDGTIDGNIRTHVLTVRRNGNIKGDITVDTLNVYGKIDGLVKARHVHLYKNCHVEGVLMHETLIIEDGAFLDGKCKRTDRVSSDDELSLSDDSLIPNSIRLIN